MHQSIMTKIKNPTREDWIAFEATAKHRIKILECA